MRRSSGTRVPAPAGRDQDPRQSPPPVVPLLEPAREWLSPEQLAAYLGISLSSAYRLAWDLGARRRPRVGLRVRRSVVDQHMQTPAPMAARAGPRPGSRVACPAEDEDENEQEVIPGVKRGDLKRRVGF